MDDDWRHAWPTVMPSDLEKLARYERSVRMAERQHASDKQHIANLERDRALLLRFAKAYARYEDEDRYDHPTGVTSETFSEYRDAWQALIYAGLLAGDEAAPEGQDG